MTRILFVSIENAARGQMAEGFCRKLGQDVECASAGTQPAPNVQHNAVAVMGEVGINISEAHPRALGEVLPGRWDYVISVCDVECPFAPGAKLASWEIPDPRGQPLAGYRRARDVIRTEVADLLSRLAEAEK